MAKSRRRIRRYYASVKRRSSGMKIPIAPIVGIISSQAINNAAVNALQGNFPAALSWMKEFVGVDGQGNFQWPLLQKNMMPVVAGLLVHKAAGMIGINRALGAAKVPLLRV